MNAAGNGRFSASVTPAGRWQITFHTLEVDGGLRVLPSDVIPYLSAGVLDADLFDVEELIAAGLAGFWLDAKVHPTLDRSTHRLGAPAVRAGGTDGSGVTVAVLDTGIDATHPDRSSQIGDLARSGAGEPDQQPMDLLLLGVQ